MTQNDIELQGFLAFYRGGSGYDLLQISEETGWSQTWTFAPCDSHAAERAGWMAKRIVGSQGVVRHVRRARLRCSEGEYIQAIILTQLPARIQHVWNLDTGEQIQVRFLEDEALNCLEVGLGKGAHREASATVSQPK